MNYGYAYGHLSSIWNGYAHHDLVGDDDGDADDDAKLFQNHCHGICDHDVDGGDDVIDVHACPRNVHVL